MIRNLSRSYIVFVAFLAGMLSAVLIVFVIGYFISTNYTLRQIEENTAFPTISDKYLGDHPEVYIQDMTLVQMLKEGKELADMGDGLTLNVMISRYDLILSERADVFLTKSVRDLPLKEVFSEDGMDLIMNTVHIGEFRGYEEREVDGVKVWYDTKTDQPVKGINRVIAGLTLAETLSSDFSFSALLDDLTLGEALGYELGEDGYYKNGEKASGLIASLCDSPVSQISNRVNDVQLAEIFGYTLTDGVYYDKSGNKVTGIMSVICDTNVHGVPDKVNSARFCDILGYELGEDGKYYDNGSEVTGVMSVMAECTVTTAPDTIKNANMGEIMGYTFDTEAGAWVDSEGNAVHTLMNTISSKKISELNNLYKDLTVADVIPADERGEDTGYVSLLNPETPLNEISVEVNRVFKENTMRDFVACGAITFENDPDGTKSEEFVNSTSPMADMTMDKMLTFVFANKAAFDQLYSQQNP